MDLFEVEGVYEDCRIELTSRPAGIVRARVRVTFLEELNDATRLDAREEARQRAFGRMKLGINFGGERFNREEIYEERLEQLEACAGGER